MTGGILLKNDIKIKTKKPTTIMTVQLLQSQINTITARLEQIKSSGYFSEEEIEKYSKQESEKLAQLQSQLDTAKAKNIEVIVEPEML